MNSMKKLKGSFGIICAAALICSACGKTDSNLGTTSSSSTSDNTSEAEDYIYTLNEIELETPSGANIEYLCQNDDGIYGLQSVYSENEPAIYSVIAISGENTGKEITLKTDENTGLNNLAADNDGNFYTIETSYGETTNEEIHIDDEEISVESTDEITEESGAKEDVIYYMPEMTQSVVKFSSDGELVWKSPITIGDTDTYTWIDSIVFAPNAGVVISSQSGVSVFDADSGKETCLQSDYIKEISEDHFDNRSLYSFRDGNLYMLTNSGRGENTLYRYNSKKDFDEVTSGAMKQILEGISIYAGKDHDILFNRSDGLYSYNIGDEEFVKICDYLSSDITVNYGIRYAFEEDADNILLVVSSATNWSTDFYRLTKVDSSEVAEKTKLTLAAYYVSEGVRKAVADFNKSNPEYRIVIKDYAEYDRNEGEDGIEKLNLEIAAGEVPDIIELGGMIPYDSYLKKGLFEPLDDYYSSDTELANGSFLDNVLSCGKRNGKLYTIIPQFSVTTCVASADVLQGETLTWSNYKEICEKRNMDPALMLGDMTRDEAYYIYSIASHEFVDKEAGTCNFDDPAFYNLLDYVKLLPEKSNESSSDSLYREKKALLYPANIYELDEYIFIKKGYFGCDIVYNGVPGISDGDSYVYPTMQLAMSSTCQHKDVAWQFMRYFLTDDFQDKIEYYLPVSQKAFNAALERAQENPYYIDENGEKHEMMKSRSMDDVDVDIEAISADEANQFGELVRSITDIYDEDDEISNIIYEEVDAYYTGQKSAEEVANIIQSRVSLYISENS